LKIMQGRLESVFEKLGSSLLGLFVSVFDFFQLCLRTTREIFLPPFPSLSLLIDQFYILAVKSFPLVAVTSISTGAVMALQFGYGMERFGGTLYVPTIVAASMVKVLGPLFTCLMLAGRAGAGVAAEIASMNVTQQVDALKALGTNPIAKLVVPRTLALAFGAPLLSNFADVLGIAGGLAVGVSQLNISSALYLHKSLEAVSASDIILGNLKTMFYGAIIGLIASFEGLRTQNGTIGIGHATTQTVVKSSIFVMVSDLLITKLTWMLR
jgi:phospholipid/cholesterol/gamma-HCH transport system permease protein